MADELIYFAYGHNSNTKEFKKRIPDAIKMGTASLNGWKLELKHFANIFRDSNSVVDGVIYKILPKDFKALDRDEAYKVHYNRIKVTVNFDGEQLQAITYIMTTRYEDKRLPNKKELPTKKYIRWIANGYKDNGISIKQLIDALACRIKEAYGWKNGQYQNIFVL